LLGHRLRLARGADVEADDDRGRSLGQLNVRLGVGGSGVAVDSSVGVAVAVLVGVAVGSSVGVAVAVLVGVTVAVLVSVAVDVGVGVRGDWHNTMRPFKSV
jgi:hypothetical protein